MRQRVAHGGWSLLVTRDQNNNTTEEPPFYRNSDREQSRERERRRTAGGPSSVITLHIHTKRNRGRFSPCPWISLRSNTVIVIIIDRERLYHVQQQLLRDYEYSGVVCCLHSCGIILDLRFRVQARLGDFQDTRIYLLLSGPTKKYTLHHAFPIFGGSLCSLCSSIYS